MRLHVISNQFATKLGADGKDLFAIAAGAGTGVEQRPICESNRFVSGRKIPVCIGSAQRSDTLSCPIRYTRYFPSELHTPGPSLSPWLAVHNRAETATVSCEFDQGGSAPGSTIVKTICFPSGETLGPPTLPATETSLRGFEPSLSATYKSVPFARRMRPSGKKSASCTSALPRRRGSPAGSGIDHAGTQAFRRPRPSE